MSDRAPFFAEVSHGAEDVRAYWTYAEDDVRLRVALWPGGPRGTVLLFAGRTEYLEKYGVTAAELRESGLSMASVDWRGQGLSDRFGLDDRVGHVGGFMDYQFDVAALEALARRQGMPEPYFLLAHSMGGCIGLRSLMEGLPVRAVCFTAPMWGISMHAALRPVAWGVSWTARALGQGVRYVPATGPATYVDEAAFAGNLLTTDREMFEAMQRQVAAHPELALGGPSLHWLYEALAECRHLARRRSPQVPCVTYLGSNERIVPKQPVLSRMARWPGGELVTVEGGEHEILMERAETRAEVMARLRRLFLGR